MNINDVTTIHVCQTESYCLAITLQIKHNEGLNLKLKMLRINAN